MSLQWVTIDHYRLNVDTINNFLGEIFGTQNDFGTQVRCLL
jgi:hypothetical protein